MTLLNNVDVRKDDRPESYLDSLVACMLMHAMLAEALGLRGAGGAEEGALRARGGEDIFMPGSEISKPGGRGREMEMHRSSFNLASVQFMATRASDSLATVHLPRSS